MLGELDRQKVGQLADMTGRARTGAATGLGTIGAQQTGSGAATTGQGVALSGQGIGAQANALYGAQQGYNQGVTQREQDRRSGSTVGTFLHGILSSIPWGKRGGGKQIYDTPAGPGY